jgi:hypothetical protein
MRVLAPEPNGPIVDMLDNTIESGVLKTAFDLFVNSQILSELVPSFERDPASLIEDAAFGGGAIPIP